MGNSFTIRQIKKDGEFTIDQHGDEAILDDHVIEQLYLPVKKYFIKKYQAPITLSVHRTRAGIPCLDFIYDARISEEFNHELVVNTYRKVVDVFMQSDYDVNSLQRFKINIGPCVPLLAGDRDQIVVHSDKYDRKLFALVRELYPIS